MHEIDPSVAEGIAWRIRAIRGGPDLHVAPIPNRQLRPAGSDAGRWESLGGRPCFRLAFVTQDAPLEAGWYELRGNLEAEAGEIVLPSLRADYIDDCANDGEQTLPGPDGDGCVRALLRFVGEVGSLWFYPGIEPVVFRMRDFSLHPVSRMHALRAMLGQRDPSGRGPGRIRRALTWGRNVAGKGVRPATDDLYTQYRRCMRPPGLSDYDIWTRRYDTPGKLELVDFARRAAALGGRGPLLSVLLPVRGVPEHRLRRCLDSVLAQAWPRWELCVVDADSAGPHVPKVLVEYAHRDARVRVAGALPEGRGADAWDAALGMAGGDFTVLLDPGDELRPHSLLRVAEVVTADPDLVVVYSDEDRIDGEDRRHDPYFKPDWNPDLLLGQDYIHRLVAVRVSVARDVGGMRAGFDDSQGYDLILRCIECLSAQQIHHIPEILYHQRDRGSPDTGGSECSTAGARALSDHLRRTRAGAKVVPCDRPPGLYRVRWPLPDPAPRVSLIIPTRDRVDLLRMCVESILGKTVYPDFELVVVDNQSRDPAALDYLRELGQRERVRVLRYDAPFNYSAINNWAVRQCDGVLLGLVNNDIEVISPDWLEEMTGLAVRPGTGAVGAMLYYPDDTIQHAGVVAGMLGLAGHIYCGMPRGCAGHAGRALVVQDLSAVTAACLLVRRKVFEEVGGLDERLAVAFNDVDFCLRIRERGYRNVWTPFAELYHHESASRGSDDTDAKRLRSAGEVAYMRERWRDILDNDPAYNPNLSLRTCDAELAFPPRPKVRPNG